MASFHVLARKDPDSRFPYQVDLSEELADLGETLSGAVVQVVLDTGEVDPDTDMVVESVTFTAEGVVTFWLSGGSTTTSGSEKRYYVRVRVTGTSTTPVQFRDDITVIIPVANR